MKYFFWNTNKKIVNEYIKDLIMERDYDIVALAEYEDNINELLTDLKKQDIYMFNIETKGCERITLITKLKPQDIEHCEETEYSSIKILNLNYDKKQILSIVHMPSKLHANDRERRVELVEMIENIQKYETEYDTKNTVIVGDFNANPFDECMISADGLHALADSSLCNPKYSRIVKRRVYNTFYNPMWNKFGDFNGIPGTYYYRESSLLVYFWNIFDQVIIRPEIKHCFDRDGLNIITKIKDKSLIENNKIVVSDHLPIEFIIKEE